MAQTGMSVGEFRALRQTYSQTKRNIYLELRLPAFFQPFCKYAAMTREYGQSSALSVMTRKNVSQMTEIAGCFGHI